jgi:hypothetical protein
MRTLVCPRLGELHDVWFNLLVPVDEVELTPKRAVQRFRLRKSGLLLGVLALIGIAVWFVSARSGGGRLYSVTATVDLRGAPCRSHAAQCAVLVNGGSVIIFGPEQDNVAAFPEHRVHLKGETTAIRIRLPPGRYLFAFDVAPPYSVLLPNFGDGSFDVASAPIDLGVVRPSPTWAVQGD